MAPGQRAAGAWAREGGLVSESVDGAGPTL